MSRSAEGVGMDLTLVGTPASTKDDAGLPLHH
jgi:hypothetical protein